MLKVLLESLYLDIKLRLLSKTFMNAFDEVCSEKLLLLDPQLRSLIKDGNGQLIISPIGTFLPKSVPILKLYTSYLNVLDKKSFDDKFPVPKIPENASLELSLNSEYERLIEMLRSLIEKEYGENSKGFPPPMRLCRLYRLLVAIFSEQAFIDEIVNSIDFPVKKLPIYAASGKLENRYGVEILSRFSINSMPPLLLNVIGSDNPDLVRAILNNPQNDLVTLSDQQCTEFDTPMHKAAFQGNAEIINLMAGRGFPANVEGNRGLRPIHLAAMCGNYDAVVKLFEFDNDVTSSPLNTRNEAAPIVSAAQEGHINIVEFFLNQATVDMTNNQVTSRLLVEVALQRRNAKLGQLLIDSAKVMLTADEIKKLRSLK